MIFSFKTKIILILLGVMLLGNVTFAACSFNGPREFTIFVRVGLAQGTYVSPTTIKCDLDTQMTPITKQPVSWYNFFSSIQYDLIPEYGLVPREKMEASFNVRLRESDGGKQIANWNFDMAKDPITNNTAAPVLKAGVEYTYEVSNVQGLVHVGSGNVVELKTEQKPRETYMQLPYAIGNFSVIGNVSNSTGGNGGEDSPCTASAFIVDVPSQVNFKRMEIDAIEAGTEFVEPFTITITRKPSQNCLPYATPALTFTTANTVIDKYYAKIPERGLLLSIYRAKYRYLLSFGSSYSWGRQYFFTPAVETYEGRIKRDPSAKVTPGPFSVTVNYDISYR